MTAAVNINASAAGSLRITTTSKVSGAVTVSNVVNAVARYQRSRPTSVNNPIRADGTRKPSNWISSGGTFSQKPGVLRLENAGQIKDLYGSLANAPGISSTLVGVSDLPSVAIRDALGHFGEAQMQLGVALREVGSTAGLLAQYYRGASRMLSQVTEDVINNGNFRRAMRDFRHGWKEAPSRYLEYLYGMRPLADDVNNAVDVLTTMKLNGYAMRLTLKGKAYLRDRELKSVQAPTTGCLLNLDVALRAKCKASLSFQLPNWFWDNVPVVTAFSEAYETAPYSFVLDWALPIGSWIRGFEGLSLRPFFKEGSTTYFMRGSSGTLIVSGVSGYSAAPDKLGASYKYWYMRREAFTTFPTERVMRLPRLRSPLRISNMDQWAALAGQRLGKLNRAIG